jgi:hypothetical protein
MSSVAKFDAPKGQKKCRCGTNLSSLDPHPTCKRCCPRECTREAPCEFCAPLTPTQWDSWEVQASKSKPYAKRAKRVVAKFKEPSNNAGQKSKALSEAPTKVGKKIGGGSAKPREHENKILHDRLDSMQSMFTQFMQTFQAAQTPSPNLQSVSSQIVTEEGTSTFPPPTATVTRPKSPSPEMGTSNSKGVGTLGQEVPMELDAPSLIIPLTCGLTATPTASGQVSFAGSPYEPASCPPPGAGGFSEHDFGLLTRAGPAGSLRDQSTGHVPVPLAPLGIPAGTIYGPARIATSPAGPPTFVAPFAGISPRGTIQQGLGACTTIAQAIPSPVLMAGLV